MKKAFFFVVLIAILAAFFASSHPDGLEKVAEHLGFIGKAAERGAPLPDYTTPGMPEGGLSTATAGIAGVLITMAVFWLSAYGLKVWKNIALVFVVCFLFGSVAWGTRSLVTDDFGTVDPGKFELEVGYNSTTPKVGGTTTNGLGVSLKRGFTSNFDFGIEAPYSLTSPTGLGDAVLHAKLKVLEQGENDGLTARVDVKLPNVTGFTDYSLFTIYSKKIGDLKTHYNLSYTLVGNPTGANTTNYSVAVEKEVTPGVDVVAEYYAVSSSGGATGNIQVGGRWQALEAVRFDAGYSLALNDNSNNVITAGLTAEF